MSQSTIEPVAPQERIQTIDIIRAFALLGVVIANFTVDNADISPAEGRTWFFDQLAYWPIRFFIDDKAMATYCFLFGLGFAIQMMRAEARKANYILLHVRRMFALFIIGSIAWILSTETIPHEYAMVGLFLLMFYKLPWKILPALGILCVLIPFAINLRDQAKMQSTIENRPVISIDTASLDKYTGVYDDDQKRRLIIFRKNDSLIGEGPIRHFALLPLSDSQFIRRDFNHIFTFRRDSAGFNKLSIKIPNGTTINSCRVHVNLQQALKEQLARRVANNKRTQKPFYAQYVKQNALQFWDRFRHWSWNDALITMDISMILSYFLFGLYAGRRRIFYDSTGNKQFLQNVMSFGFIIGVVGMSTNLGSEALDFINHKSWTSHPPVARASLDVSWDLGVMAMTFAYVSALTLLLENAEWKQRLSFLAPVGRMGFTNYLLHIIPYVVLFHYGFDLSGKIGPFYRLLLAIPVYVGLIYLSRWWFRRFAIGPAEWLWRSITYWQLQPMRIRQQNPEPIS